VISSATSPAPAAAADPSAFPCCSFVNRFNDIISFQGGAKGDGSRTLTCPIYKKYCDGGDGGSWADGGDAITKHGECNYHCVDQATCALYRAWLLVLVLEQIESVALKRKRRRRRRDSTAKQHAPLSTTRCHAQLQVSGKASEAEKYIAGRNARQYDLCHRLFLGGNA
jgi:hypothetical protein